MGNEEYYHAILFQMDSGEGHTQHNKQFFLHIQEIESERTWSSTYAQRLEELIEPLVRAKEKLGVYLHQVSTLPASRLIIDAGWIEKQIPSAQLEEFLIKYRTRIKDLPHHIPANIPASA